MKKNIWLICLSLLFSAGLFAQQTQNTLSPSTKYWVFFSDKNNTPFTVNTPVKFLSQRSIDRRNRMHIPITESDLPVDPAYILQVENICGPVIIASRWLNAISVNLNATQLATVSELPFVKTITPVKIYRSHETIEAPYNENIFTRMAADDNYAENDYGPSWNQIHMMNLDYLHQIGLNGTGMVIAQLDAGWIGVDVSEAFSEFWNDDRILGYHNFPDHDSIVFFSSTHGANVLSIMGANVPGKYIGAAPDAKFYLFRTEIADSEHVVEEDYWMQGAERADSVGADIINSSLGYTTFDNPAEDHTYADLDGNTTIVTIAADMAAQKGILVCNSAGNEGTSDWHYISAPADGDSVFTIGAVDPNGVYADFSSVGPTADGRLKPNVSAEGESTAFIDATSGLVYTGSGTSYSSPLMAGACACLWQAFPDKNNMQIIDAVQRSASIYDNPNDEIGYGIPDFAKAYFILKEGEGDLPKQDVSIFPNPAANFFMVPIKGQADAPATITISDMSGRKILEQSFEMKANELNDVFVYPAFHFSAGMYLVNTSAGSFSNTEKLIIR